MSSSMTSRLPTERRRLKEPGTALAPLNEEWVKMFPDPEALPARHTLALGAESNALVTCDFVAVFG